MIRLCSLASHVPSSTLSRRLLNCTAFSTIAGALRKMDTGQESRKRFANGERSGRRSKRPRHVKKSSKQSDWPECSKDEVLIADIRELLSKTKLDDSKAAIPIELKQETDVQVTELSSTGNGLAVHAESKSVLVVPFAVPGDTVTVKPFRRFEQDSYYMTDFIKVINPSSQRDDSLIRCPYFAKCSGCQFQMLSYNDQLANKKSIVENAYRNFSGLDPKNVPIVRDTMGSPLQYGYRTKLTPHFDSPPGFGGRGARKRGIHAIWDETPPIGFMLQGTHKTIDIEDCPIGTDVVRRGMKRERARVAKEIDTYKRGATILLRENTKLVSKDTMPDSDIEILRNSKDPEDPIVEDHGDHYHLKSCITDNKAKSKEYIDDFVFTNPAGAFFQNNNSILSPFIKYIRDQIIPPSSSTSQISYLVDAYCGSGLFTITLSSLFKKSIGIDISPASIEFAQGNATQNGMPSDQAKFMTGDASHIFSNVEHFPANETVIIIDPPRKGCDRSFLSQLLKFGPERIVYVSCNVHTQARDVGCLVKGLEDVDAGFGEGVGAYQLESLRGFDFFPQTGHVEGVAVLQKKPPKLQEDDAKA
jgi:tRNA (uracil-5-)-methyltransferase